MGHAHHFLSRLDRLCRDHVELALSLYQDDARLRYVLEKAHVPEGYERVAVSLDDPHEGPFVVVTRSGRFVTCLGRGMHASNLHVIQRAELDAISAKHTLWQGRDAEHARFGGGKRGSLALFRRVIEAGPYLAREEFQALAALRPLIGGELHVISADWNQRARGALLELRPALKKRGLRLRPEQLDGLHNFWKLSFAAGHAALASVADDGERLQQLATENPTAFEGLGTMLVFVVCDGQIEAKLGRGGWAMAQLGPAWIPYAAKQLRKASTMGEVMYAVFALQAIGARYPDHRAEVIEVFRRGAELSDPDAASWAQMFCTAGPVGLEHVDEIAALHLRDGRNYAMQCAQYCPEGSPHRYAREEDVPDEIAFAHPFHLAHHTGVDGNARARAFAMMVQAGRATPEQLFLPKSYVDLIEPTWEPEHAFEIVGPWIADLKKNPPPRPEGQTKNGACPCGSGKKYKRCCGVVAAG